MQYVLILRSVLAIALASALVLSSGLAVAQDATPATEAVPLEPLMGTTVPPEALPTEPALSFILWRATIEPGFRVAIPAESVACCPGPQLNHVLAGELTLRVDGPLQVVRAGADGSPAPLEDVPPGTEVILRPGDSAIYRFEFPSEYANAGSERVHFVSGGLFGDSPPGPPGAYVLTNFDEVYPVSSLPSGPVTLSLGRATLAPDAALPAPPP